jgi:hypothetical protein
MSQALLNSDLKICQDACRLLGANPPEAFDDGSIEGETCESIYENLVRAALSGRQWTWASTATRLAQLDKESIYGFDSVYQLPSDLVQIFTTIEPRFYRIENGELHTFDQDVDLVYTFRKPTNAWPHDFQLAMKYVIAAEICLPITGNSARTDLLAKTARMKMKEAGYNDSQGIPNKAVRRSRFISVRTGGNRLLNRF